MPNKPNRILWLLLYLVVAGPVWAADGVIQINQARALAGGITPGDTAGYPVTLSRAGAYILTSDLTAPDQNTTLISIVEDRVSIDLNGFSIVGTTLCASPPTCTNTGTGIGISSVKSTIAIENGLVTGMGNSGIALSGLGFRLSKVSVTHCGGGGIVLGARGWLSDTLVGFNGGTGISIGLGANLVNASSGLNGVNGFVGGDAASISGGGFGGNVGNGIVTGGSATIENVNASGNGGDGITVSYGSLIQGCLASGNTGTGIVFPATIGSTASGYKDCIINSNGVATVSGSEGAQIGTNLCGTNTTCP